MEVRKGLAISVSKRFAEDGEGHPEGQQRLTDWLTEATRVE